jgi:Na+-transporting NADH:ubiquinone oxidoreductase subunit D
MCLALTAVLAFSMAAISAIRRFLPGNVRLIVQMTIIAALVIVADEVIKTWAYETSRQLSVFVGLIITNCIVLGRAEAYASKHPPRLAFLDGLGNGLGYSLVLVAVATTRELLGAGTLLGVTVLPASTGGGWYPVNGFLRQPPSAFFLLGLLVWAARSARPAQVEQPEYPPAAEAEAARA